MNSVSFPEKVKNRLKRVTYKLRSRLAPGGLILMYHRVTEINSDPWSLCVSPQHFAEHLEVLKQSCRPLKLEQMTQEMQERKRLSRSVAITFDDGYADNLHQAKPVLERYDIPATIFLAAGYLGQEKEFWWDELDKLLLQPGLLPEKLHLEIRGQLYIWELGGEARCAEDTFTRHQGWRVEKDTPSPSIRQALYAALWKLLQPLDEEERQRVLTALRSWAGTTATGRLTHRALTLAEAVAIDQGGLIELGAHTVNHPALASISTEAQQAEIQQSKTRLEELLGHSVHSFAYPYGSFNEQTPGLVQGAGFARACSTIAGTVWPRSDPFLLPRVEVHDWDGEEFGRRLSRWLKGDCDYES
jgi:peptidoglycan/xylan/chitin deacetylase (PgdA/CDA1 family)